MRMRKCAAVVSMVLALVLLLSGCGRLSADSVMNVIAPEETPVPGSDLTFTGKQDETVEPLRLTYEDMDGAFCPFWADTDGDRRVVELTQLSLISARDGQSPSEISQEQNEDGSTTVTIRLKEDLLCSDGEPLTADDLLFTYYVLMDADYDGPSEVSTLPVRGLSAYWNAMDMDIYGKYMFLYDEIYNGGRYDQDLKDALEAAKKAALNNGVKEEHLDRDKQVQEAQAALDQYDYDRADQIREAVQAAWRQDANALVEYVIGHYSASISLRTPFTREEVLDNQGLQVMYTMLERNFGEIDEDSGVFTSNSGKEWDLKDSFPTMDDLYEEMTAAYSNAEQYWLLEGVGRRSMFDAVQNELVRQWAPEDAEWRGTVDSIVGIEKRDDRTIAVTLEYCDESLLKILTDVYIVPLRHYGDPSHFSVKDNEFGFTRGDLKSIRDLSGDAFGGGEFVYRNTEIRTVYLDPNENYWLGVSPTPEVILSKAN